MLRELGYKEIEIYHMNEGHAAFVPFALLPEFNYKDEEVKKRCVFTTHTPIPEGHDIFDYKPAWKYAKEYLPWHIKNIAGVDRLSMTQMGFNFSKYKFGVSKKHGQISRQMFPGVNIDSITNGIHHRIWSGSTMQDLYNEYLPGWVDN